MISLFDLLIQRKYKSLTIKILNAYSIGPAPTETKKRHTPQENNKT